MENEMIIDWFQFTLFPAKKYKSGYKEILYKEFAIADKIIPVLFKELFNITSSDIIKEPTGLNGYDIKYSYKEIYIMASSNREDMGVNILLSGQGCRDFEKLNIEWNTLFDKILNFEVNFNRIDIAIDTFSNKYYTIELIKKYIQNGACSSKFIKSLEICNKGIDNGLISGNQVQFGSRAGNLQVTFYDKLLERTSVGKVLEDNIKYWFRCELRFRHESAREVFNMIQANKDYSNLIKSVLYDYIDFKKPSPTDTNKSRWPTVSWWSRFLENCSKLHLCNRSSETSITKKYNWLLESTSKTNFMVYLSKLYNIKADTISIDLMYELIINGFENIKDKDILLINDYRISNNMERITKNEILDYVQDLKDTILL